MKFDSVIFDLDGTLLDTLQDLADSINAALSASGLPERSVDEVRRFVGNGIRALAECAVPDGCEASVTDAVFEAFKANYKKFCTNNTKPYDGVIPLLERLKREGIPAAIVSNKADGAVKNLSKQYFGDLVAEAIGEREGIARKPAPDSVLEAARLLNSKTPLYVGDSEVDVATVRNAGIDGAFVTWGFRTPEQLRAAGGKTLCADCDELYGVIKS